MSTPSQAISSAISAVLSTPMRSMSDMVMMLVWRSRATFTASRGTCQPPMPTCTRFLAGTFGRLVAWNHGVVCIRSSRSFSWMSAWRSKCTMPIFFEVHCGDAAHGRESRSNGRRRR